MPSPSTSSASWFNSEPSMPGSIRINPSSPRTAMELVQTHPLCRTQTPSATSVSMALWDHGVGVIGRADRNPAREPVAQRAVELLVVATIEGVRSHPPSDVDVVVHELRAQLGAPPHRVQVAAAEVADLVVVDGFRKGRSFSELLLVPDEVD